MAFDIGGLAGEEPVDSRVLLEGAYNWPRMRPLGEPAVHPRLVRLTSLIVIVLLALGFWTAAIWAAVAIFASAA
jgi:hypothetical protein